MKVMRICTKTKSLQIPTPVNLHRGGVGATPEAVRRYAGDKQVGGWVEGDLRNVAAAGVRSFRYRFMHLVALNSLHTGKREGRRIFGASTGPVPRCH